MIISIIVKRMNYGNSILKKFLITVILMATTLMKYWYMHEISLTSNKSIMTTRNNFYSNLTIKEMSLQLLQMIKMVITQIIITINQCKARSFQWGNRPSMRMTSSATYKEQVHDVTAQAGISTFIPRVSDTSHPASTPTWTQR